MKIQMLDYPHGYRRLRIHAADYAPTVTTSMYEHNNLIVEEREVKSLGVLPDPHKNFGDVAVYKDVCMTLLSTNYKSPPLVIEQI